MKALIVLSCLLGMSRALGGGGCPLNYGDSCGWTESADGTLCYKPLFHGKSLYDAAELCWALGTHECPSELMYADEAPVIIEEADPMDLPQFVRVNAKAFCYDCEWFNTLEGMPYFPGPPFTPTMYHPYELPMSYEDNHIISAVWDVNSNMMTGHTPSQDRVSFICTSCVSVEHACPVICEYCIPHPPMDGMWSGWESWGECTGTCMYGTQERTRYCNPPMWNGQDCFGDDTQTRGCETSIIAPCSVDGEWGPWDSWSSCMSYAGDGGCGDGERYRDRLCNDPSPNGGANCPGSSTDYEYCDMGRSKCVFTVNGGWCSWDPWDKCSSDCGFGVSTRHRDCSCPKPSGSGSSCSSNSLGESSSRTRYCMGEPCKRMDGEWTSWGSWYGECAAGCGMDTEDVRSRECLTPAGEETSTCLGHWRQTKPCDVNSQESCEDSVNAYVWGTIAVGGGNFQYALVIEDIYDGGSSVECSHGSYAPYINAVTAKLGRSPVTCGGILDPYITNGAIVPGSICYFGDISSFGFDYSLYMYHNARFGATVAQLTPFSFMIIGGGPAIDQGATTEFYLGRFEEDYGHQMVPGPHIPVESMFGACAVALDSNTVVVMGGRIDGKESRRVLKYDMLMDEWSELPEMLVEHVNGHCALFDSNSGPEIVITMGDTKTKSLEIYNVEKGKWRFGAPCPIALEDSYSFVVSKYDELHVSGGYIPGLEYLNYRSYIYDYEFNAWYKSWYSTAPVIGGSAVAIDTDKAIAECT